MNLNEYQQAARRTAIYEAKLIYPTLGLCGEVGEVVAGIVNMGDDVYLLKEIGDVLWYVANIATDLDMTLSYICGQNEFDFNSHPWLWDTDACEDMVINAGVVAENVKKVIRDSKGFVPDNRKMNIKLALCDIMKALAAIADNSNSTLEDCAAENLVKLNSRKERGVLGGDGDNR